MDNRLLPRIEQILQSSNKRVVDLESIVDELRLQHREYQRKKRNAFRKSVEKAYNSICSKVQEKRGDSYTKFEKDHLKRKQLTGDGKADEGSNSSEDSFSEENTDYVDYQDTNKVNSMMSNLYKKTPIQKRNRLDAGKAWSAPASPRRNLGGTPSASPQRFSNDEDSVPPGSTPDLFFIDRMGTNKRPKLSHVEKSNAPAGSPSFNGSVLGEERKQVMERTTNVTEDSGNVGSSDKKQSKRKAKAAEDNKSANEKKLRKKKGADVQVSEVKFADVGGNDATLVEVCKLLVHMKHPEVYRQLGVTPPRGFLLHGPPGCGKTLLAHAIAGELELPFIKMAATEIVSGVSGESEEKLRDVFEQAVSNAPCILFLDEIDSITQKRENASKDMERRIVSQLLTCMDDLNSKTDAHVLVIGATNRPDSIDPALRRAGRFDREISLGIPDEAARKRILEVLCGEMRLAPDLSLAHLARMTPGFVGADLKSLAREAAIAAVNRVFAGMKPTCETKPKHEPSQTDSVTPHDKPDQAMEVCEASTQEPDQLTCGSHTNTKTSDKGEPAVLNCDNMDKPSSGELGVIAKSSNDLTRMDLASVLTWLKDQPPLTETELSTLYITVKDFSAALAVVQPSAKREGFATVPDVTWDDIGALKEIRKELQIAILAPVQHPEHFEALGLTSPTGILLAGPPGCGKTLLAKAIANESGINFISVKGPELLNMYVGESERAVRQVFQRARNSAPCVIFFDELDALVPKRSVSGEGGASVRVVNQMLTEMDGFRDRKHVFIMGATNRPDMIDQAILRHGRLGKILFVDLPSSEDRWDILKTITKNGTQPSLATDVNLRLIAEDAKCFGFTGADLAALVREASVNALQEFMSTEHTPNQSPVVCNKNFEAAFRKVKPSVSEEDYRRFKERVNKRIKVGDGK